MNKLETKIGDLLLEFYLAYGNQKIMTDITLRASIRRKYIGEIIKVLSK
jgi:hypothetical protein